jgi:hypothetical protein
MKEGGISAALAKPAGGRRRRFWQARRNDGVRLPCYNSKPYLCLYRKVYKRLTRLYMTIDISQTIPNLLKATIHRMTGAER